MQIGGEMESPRRNLPQAGKRYSYLLVAFYVLGALAISMVVPSNDEKLLGGAKGAGASPGAIAANNAGIKGLDSVINAVILTSAWSAGNSYLFLASRALYSMTQTGGAPKVFLKCTKSGIPWVAAATSATFCLLAYLNCSSSGVTVFVNLIGAGAYQSWVLICVIYIRFRRATFAQNITDLPYRSSFQPYMSYVSGTFFFLLLLVNRFRNFLSGGWNTSNFITAYIGIPIWLAFYCGHKLLVGRDDPLMLRPEQIDLITGLDEVLAAEKPAEPRGRMLGGVTALWS